MAIGQIEALLFSLLAVFRRPGRPRNKAMWPTAGQIHRRSRRGGGTLHSLGWRASARPDGASRPRQQIVGDRHTAEDAFQATFWILARKAGLDPPAARARSGTGFMAWRFGLPGRQECGTIAGDSASSQAQRHQGENRSTDRAGPTCS